MSDLGLSVVVTRTLLGLPDLNLNDGFTYYPAAGQFLGGQSSWQRNQVTSPFMDGAVTVSRNRQMVTEPLAIEVLGDHPLEVQTNMNALVAAFSQAKFSLGVEIGAAIWSYDCEAADVTRAWQTSRMVANQWQIVFAVPRQPNATAGGY